MLPLCLGPVVPARVGRSEVASGGQVGGQLTELKEAGFSFRDSFFLMVQTYSKKDQAGIYQVQPEMTSPHGLTPSLPKNEQKQKQILATKKTKPWPPLNFRAPPPLGYGRWALLPDPGFIQLKGSFSFSPSASIS